MCQRHSNEFAPSSAGTRFSNALDMPAKRTWPPFGCLPLLALTLAGCSAGPLTDSVSQAIGSCAAVSSTNFEYESDACKRKKSPTNTERTVSCPMVSTNGDGFAPSSAPMQIDDTALKGI